GKDAKHHRRRSAERRPVPQRQGLRPDLPRRRRRPRRVQPVPPRAPLRIRRGNPAGTLPCPPAVRTRQDPAAHQRRAGARHLLRGRLHLAGHLQPAFRRGRRLQSRALPGAAPHPRGPSTAPPPPAHRTYQRRNHFRGDRPEPRGQGRRRAQPRPVRGTVHHALREGPARDEFIARRRRHLRVRQCPAGAVLGARLGPARCGRAAAATGPAAQRLRQDDAADPCGTGRTAPPCRHRAGAGRGMAATGPPRRAGARLGRNL
ncbi:MAG: Transcriptional regulator, AraC family, partial [uncultured Arthrobacter sp.]